MDGNHEINNRVSSGPGNDLEFGEKTLKIWNLVEVDFICTKVSK